GIPSKFPTCGGALRIHRPGRRHHRNVTTWSGMPQRLGNKVIVNRMMLTVIRLVSNREIPKRNIAHHRIETLVGESGLFKPMRLDLSRWVHPRGYPRGRLV